MLCTVLNNWSRPFIAKVFEVTFFALYDTFLVFVYSCVAWRFADAKKWTKKSMFATYIQWSLLSPQVQKVHIGHDSKGRNKGLFVEEIEVTAPEAPKVIFPCRCWLAENEDDGKTARVIEPGESLTQPYDSK